MKKQPFTQCPYCGDYFVSTGIQNHITVKHERGLNNKMGLYLEKKVKA